MALPIFYISEYNQEDIVILNEDTSRHVVQVLRMKSGQLLQLTDGKGSLLTAAIMDEHKKSCSVTIKKKIINPAPVRKISIAISLLKNTARFEWFLEKATEIGVTEILPLKSERTEKQHFRFDRMNNILIAAMLQSQQTWLPALKDPQSFLEIVNTSTADNKLIAHCEEVSKHAITEFAGQSSTQILIGPEGDFSAEEISVALTHNYHPVSLGKTRLRTETAGVVAASLLCI